MERPSSNVYAFPGATLPRRCLWDLPPGLHCAAVGVGLPVEDLRAALDELFGGASTACDYELHAAVVRECATRNKVSERVQAELDRRHAGAVARFEGATGRAMLAERWSEAIEDGDVAGALWAVVGHPHCDADLAEHVARETHMLQHRALGVAQEAQSRAKALAIENRLLHARLAELLRERHVGRPRPRSWRERLSRAWNVPRVHAPG